MLRFAPTLSEPDLERELLGGVETAKR
jgi:hypothetical protein